MYLLSVVSCLPQQESSDRYNSLNLRIMKRFAIFGLFLSLAAGCTPLQPAPLPAPYPDTGSPSPTPTITQPTSSPSSTQEKNTFQSDRFGFRFQYPEGFTPDNRSENKPPEAKEALLGRLEVWDSEDYQAIASGTWKGGEYPASVTISVFDNAQKRPLAAWKEANLSRGKDKNITVAGRDALAYASTGLYEADNVLFSSPDGRYVIHIHGAYINPEDPMRQAYQKVVSSFEFQ
ncbi:hypothetical protein H6F90_20120 [Trichocoleus sp. FACHB-591]|uniref:hypothetical protein n=1 Tax=Trichocoleus sp. FACHB-591 TaxID=2692872 RepID=UPI001689D317|nr:hypothetical protein [Trichocoleus sp. FACHB-591]MBD2097408.1 hypothetical protein [Trichocoleus sp. FACHB-591]